MFIFERSRAASDVDSWKERHSRSYGHNQQASQVRCNLSSLQKAAEGAELSGKTGASKGTQGWRLTHLGWVPMDTERKSKLKYLANG